MPASTCPSCQRSLRELVHRDVTIDVCDCGGMWFDRGELQAWARGQHGSTVAPTVPERGGGAGGACPRCAAGQLERCRVQNLALARCATCAGIWLPAEAVAQLDPGNSTGTTTWWGDTAEVAMQLLWLCSW